MTSRHPVVVTGQQIGAGWTPALSVVKALAALAQARREGLRAVYWLADEDHDREEVASTVGYQGNRLVRHRFRFGSPEGTATGWLPWTQRHQQEAEELWGPIPAAITPDLRGHALALGEPLWERGLEPFSPTHPKWREPIQPELERWRSLDLERDLIRRAEQLESEGIALPLDPRTQSAWFCLDPITGLRRRLETGEPCPKGCWLSPGAALRPLMQSLLLPVEGAVLGPGERAYWRLTEPLWERVGLQPPRIIPRPTVFVAPAGLHLDPSRLDVVKRGRWEELVTCAPALPSEQWVDLKARPEWGPELGRRYQSELARARQRLARLDRRLIRDLAAKALGEDPERIRQELFPFEKAQERVMPGLFWLRDPELLERILRALERDNPVHVVEKPVRNIPENTHDFRHGCMLETLPRLESESASI